MDSLIGGKAEWWWLAGDESACQLLSVHDLPTIFPRIA